MVTTSAPTNEDFQSGITVPELLQTVQPGMRAIAVPLSRVDSVGALLQPGDFVDVILTIEDLDQLNPIVVENTSPSTGIGGEGAPYVSLDEPSRARPAARGVPSASPLSDFAIGF